MTRSTLNERKLNAVSSFAKKRSPKNLIKVNGPHSLHLKVFVFDPDTDPNAKLFKIFISKLKTELSNERFYASSVF